MSLLCAQLALQSRPVGQASEQSVIVTFQPAIKGAKMSSFERKQDAYCHHLARIQVSLRHFLDLTHPIIDRAKDVNDNLFRPHGNPLLWLQHLKDALFS